MESKCTSEGYEFLIDKELYNIETIYKCLYWYTNDFEVDISTANSSKWRIQLTNKINTMYDFNILTEQFRQNLIDFKLRDIVAKETQTIRELIIAKAFANFEEEHTTLLGDVSDPVGFDPKTL